MNLRKALLPFIGHDHLISFCILFAGQGGHLRRLISSIGSTLTFSLGAGTLAVDFGDSLLMAAISVTIPIVLALLGLHFFASLINVARPPADASKDAAEKLTGTLAKRPPRRTRKRSIRAWPRWTVAGVAVAVLLTSIVVGAVTGRLADRPDYLASASFSGVPSPQVSGSGQNAVLSFPIGPKDDVDAGFFLSGYHRWYLHTDLRLTSSDSVDNCLATPHAQVRVTVYADSHVVYGPTDLPLDGTVYAAPGGASYYTDVATLGYLSLGSVISLRIVASTNAPTDCGLSLDLDDAAVHTLWPPLYQMKGH
jgi:hypothetical protein